MKGYRSPDRSFAAAIAVLALLGGLLGGGLLGSCTTSEIGNDAPNAADGDAGAALEMPDIRLPSIRRSNRSVVKVSSLMADSADQSVAVQGTVARRVALLDGWLYQVQDETGSLWVLSDRSDQPAVGQLATVEGTVRYESIVVGEIDAGEVYLEEQVYREENN